MTLIENIQNSILDDDEDQSDRLTDLYTAASPDGKKLLDDAMICICGYSLSTLIKEAS